MKIYKKLPVIRQAGSIVAQNHSEPIHGHGYTVWDVATNTPTHHDIKNEMSHFTINVKSNKIVTDLSILPKTPRIRLFYENTSPTELKEVIVEIKKLCEPIELIPFKKQNSEEIDHTLGTGGEKKELKDLNDVDYQNSLIRDYYKEDPNISEEILDEIISINKKTNSKLENYVATQEVNWVPHKLTFSNMFSYGENNIVNFDKMDGIIGLFAKNTYGKSSIPYVTSFCLFDKCPTTNLAGNILNSEKDNMSARLDFSVGDNKYFIEKTSTKDKKGNVPVKVLFKRDSGDNKKFIDLEGESRAGTNDIIRKYVGTYDDFILTTLSIQGSKGKNLVEMGQSERKELLSRFTGLDIYDKLNKLGVEDSKEILTKLKLFKRDEFETELVNLKAEVENRKIKSTELSIELRDIDEIITKLTDNIEDVTRKLKPINIEILDVKTLSSQLLQLEATKETCKKKVAELTAKKATIEEEKKNIEDTVKNLNIEKIKQDKINNDILKTELVGIEKKLTAIKVTVKNKLEKLKHLDNHKYDPNCSFCVDNDFVKDAMKAKSELESDKGIVRELLDSESSIKIKINDNIDTEYSDYLNLREAFSNVVTRLNDVNSQLSKLSPTENDTKIEKIKTSIENIKNNEDIINWNQNVELEITKLKQRRSSVQQSDKKLVEKDIKDNSDRLSIISNKIVEIDNKIISIKKIEIEAAAYQAYVKATGKNGIPFKLLGNILPEIEDATNEILSKIVDFTISITTEEGDISIRILYGNRSWPIEMTSGMERFVSSVALRVALINVSRIPKPSFITIDEGFGALDPDNLSALPVLFSYLRNEFKFVIIISHLDGIKDYVDDTIEITKNGTFSHVEYL
jgi:DNA repair exonuclease SbcCD ATPase subunit